MHRRESISCDPSLRGPDLEIRRPAAGDAADIWKLVAKTPSLDGNAPYAYLLLCTHFAETGVVARIGRKLAGFVLGYVPPDDRETAFVWQVAVAPEARGRGLGGRLLDAWFARCARCSDVRFLEATVTPSNEASRALFSSFALRHGAPIHERVAFPEQLFPQDHEEEIALRIGPVPVVRATTFAHRETT